jgi:hypothetical protein
MGCCCFGREKHIPVKPPVMRRTSVDSSGETDRLLKKSPPTKPPSTKPPVLTSVIVDSSSDSSDEPDIPVRTLSVSLQLKGVTKTSTYDGLPVYYVIVGWGPAAAINHSTLRQSEFGKERLKGYKVMQIGYPNPWPKYLLHGMGQPPYLLSLPGFRTQPYAGNPPLVDSGFNSGSFGSAVDTELTLLSKEYPDAEGRYGVVLWIQTKAKEIPSGDFYTSLTAETTLKGEMTGADIRKLLDPELTQIFPPDVRYRVFALVSLSKTAQRLEVFYADFIDICTGSGRPQVIAPAHASVAQSRTPPWIFPEAWTEERSSRRVLNGIDAIRREMVWTDGERVCVTAGGGIALNVAEKARNQRCTLDWSARSGLFANTFELNPRNDTFLKHPFTKKPMEYNERRACGVDAEAKLMPPYANLRLATNATIKSVDIEDQSVLVKLEGGGAAIRDFWEKSKGLADDAWEFSDEYTIWANKDRRGAVVARPKFYDRLVIPTGLQTTGFGQPCYYAHHLLTGTQGRINGQDFVFDTPLSGGNFIVREGRMLGLKSPDGEASVRLLGAAGQMYPGIPVPATWTPASTTETTPRIMMWKYRYHLAASAVVDGFILAGINIAHANRFFDDGKANRNINTMTPAEIAKAARAHADEIGERRRNSNGYKSLEHLNKMLELGVDDALESVAFQFNYDGAEVL